MSMLRVDPSALGAMAGQLRSVPDQTRAAEEAIVAARNATGAIGDATAAATCHELLRRLQWFVDVSATSTAGMTRALFAAAGDYANAEQVVVSFDGVG